MKYTAAANPFPQSNGFISLSPKTASATYSEGFGNQYNSPKTMATRGFVLSKSTTEAQALSKPPKVEASLLLQTKSRSAKGGYTPTPTGSSTPSQRGTNNLTVNTPSGRSISDKKSSSATKLKSETVRTANSTPKNTLSYRPAESNRENTGYSAGQLKNWKKLEISTDFNGSKTSYDKSGKAQTTKNIDENGTGKLSAFQQSAQAIQRALQAKGINTVDTKAKDEKTSSTVEIRFEQKFRNNRPHSSSSKTSAVSSPKDSTNTSIVQQPQQKNAVANAVKENIKINNFIQSGRSSYRKDTPTNSAMKANQPQQNGEEEVAQAAPSTAKKTASNAQLDLRTSWQSTPKETTKQRRPLSAKKPERDSSKDTLQVERSNSKSDKPPTEKVSLQAFITNVKKGDVFSSIKSYGDRKETSARKDNQKPYLNLDGANKPVKAVDLNLNAPKTTPNVESKTFMVSLGKGQQGNSAAAPQTMPPRNSKNTKSSGTPVKEAVIKASQAPAKVSGRDPFIYYMTSLEKSHRYSGEPDYFVHIYKEHFLQSFQALSFVKGIKTTDPAVLNQKKVHLPRRETHKDKKTLIFDMDETLIHCNESLDMPADVVLPIMFPNGEVVEAGINVRPYAIEILKELSQYYEIVVFTASHACYANVVLDYLDPHEQYIHHRLFRDSCVVTEEGVHIKDLRVIANRNLSDMILVDNAAYSFGFQLENGIPIIPFYDNKSDQELRHLIPYLKFLSSASDLREINKQTFKLHHYTTYASPEAVLEGLVFQN